VCVKEWPQHKKLNNKKPHVFTHTHTLTHSTHTPTSLLVEDRQAGRRVLRVPDANGAVGGARGEAIEDLRVRQGPHAVLVAGEHAALDAGVWIWTPKKYTAKKCQSFLLCS